MNRSLKGVKVIIIGAGPGGLTFAKGARAHGATVEVIEQAGDPRGDNPGYTDRSFNLTLNCVGRRVLGDPRIWDGSTSVIGRAVHDFTNVSKVTYASPGDDEATNLTSVPRPVLRQHMVTWVNANGVELRFHTRVTSIDADAGMLQVITETGEQQSLSADLIVVADGVHSLGDQHIVDVLGGSLNTRVEPLSYVGVQLSEAACHGMSMHHIHFWQKPETDAVAIGLPNANGTIAALLVSHFDDVAIDESPFATLELATKRLQRDFPQLLEIEPDLAHQVLGRARGQFYYKSITDYVLGKKCVIVGDAGSASPPWAGFGANTAIYSADALVRFIVGLPDLGQALNSYQQHKRVLAELVLDYASQHGEFLNKEVTKNPQQRPIGPVLGQLVNESLAKSEIPAGVELLSFN
jgi:2-polyprenyl-6-methoxyphenol hydroxylase-like FAD-dependent oxidoreductase